MADIEQVVTEFMEGVCRNPAKGTLCWFGIGMGYGALPVCGRQPDESV